MNTVSKTLALCATSILTSGAPAEAVQEYLVTYRIHEQPEDPNSLVVLLVSLVVREASRDGSSIGWEISEAGFEQPGSPPSEWGESSPLVPSPDGLWWIQHVNVESPSSAEFAAPPLLTGIAIVLSTATTSLSFEIEGLSNPVEPVTEPYPVTGVFKYNFKLVEGGTLLAAGEEVPVEVEPLQNTPTNSIRLGPPSSSSVTGSHSGPPVSRRAHIHRCGANVGCEIVKVSDPLARRRFSSRRSMSFWFTSIASIQVRKMP